MEKTGNLYRWRRHRFTVFTESRPVIYETNLGSYSSNPEAVLEEVTKEKEMLMADAQNRFRTRPTIYPFEHENRVLNGNEAST